jgi:cytochrome c peroxidase
MLVTRAILLTTIILACQPAFAQSPELIERGRQLFFNETFEGNGRTCGTCHPATNNFTIDPAFVRGLPGNDPLFVANPSGPDLNGLEVRQFLGRSLILENLDGSTSQG